MLKSNLQSRSPKFQFTNRTPFRLTNFFVICGGTASHLDIEAFDTACHCKPFGIENRNFQTQSTEINQCSTADTLLEEKTRSQLLFYWLVQLYSAYQRKGTVGASRKVTTAVVGPWTILVRKREEDRATLRGSVAAVWLLGCSLRCSQRSSAIGAMYSH